MTLLQISSLTSTSITPTRLSVISFRIPFIFCHLARSPLSLWLRPASPCVPPSGALSRLARVPRVCVPPVGDIPQTVSELWVIQYADSDFDGVHFVYHLFRAVCCCCGFCVAASLRVNNLYKHWQRH